MKTALQILLGLTLCAIVIFVVIHSSFPIFWEREGPEPLVYSMTWHSAVMLVVLLAVTQGISFLVCYRIRKPAASSTSR
jgi:hypothetical protein